MSGDLRSDVKAMLRQIGYSEKAVEEILKWYESGGLQAEGVGERSLRSGNISQQKHKR
ncbi:MAG: hypothetical protein QXR89_03170 [Candidatus Bathyarchaeia archaeon]